MKALFLVAALLMAKPCLSAIPPVGVWEWSYTEESADIVTTPDDVGYTVTREFKADFSYLEFRNGELTRTGIYWVEDVDFMQDIIPALRIQVEGAPLETCAFYNHGTWLSLLWGSGANGFPSYPIENLLFVGVVPVGASSWGDLKSRYR